MLELAVLLAWVAVGSALGGVARFFVSGVVARAVGETFPWGTMVVNATGSVAIGVLAALAEPHVLPSGAGTWSLAVTGFLGSYTTVSSFSLQTLALAREGQWGRAGGNVVLSLLLCLPAAGFGIVATQAAMAGGPP